MLFQINLSVDRMNCVANRVIPNAIKAILYVFNTNTHFEWALRNKHPLNDKKINR